MRKFISVGLCWLAIASYTTANAQTISGPQVRLYTSTPVVGSCPNGLSDPNDGCATATPGALFQKSNFFSGGANLSGQSYFSTNPNSTWNAAWIQYPIGPNIVQSAGGDPLDPANQPTHAGFPFDKCDATDNGTWWLLECHGAGLSAWTWQNLNFGAFPSRASTNKGPVFLNFSNGVTSAQDFNNDWFGADNNCGGTPAGGFLVVQNGAPLSISIRNSVFDGNDPTCRFTNIGGINLLNTGDVTIERTYFHNIEGRPMNYRGSNTSTHLARWNAFDGWGFEVFQAHAEIGLLVSSAPGTTTPHSTFAYNTAVQSTRAADNGTVSWYLSNGSEGPSVNVLDFNHNITVTNTVGGETGANVQNSFTFHIDNGPGTGAGSTLTVDGLGPGAGATALHEGTLFYLQMGSHQIGGSLLQHLSGGFGVGSVWSTICSVPDGCDPSKRPGSAQIPVTIGNVTFNVPNVQYPVQTGTFENWTMQNACVTQDRIVVTSFSMTANLCDATGSTTGRFWVTGGSTCGSSTVFTLNRDLISGNPINAWSLNTSTNC